ncbi:MAG: 4Fe-4S dicluster domain-containing protein [Bacilli bacterium]|nr:4Fe-4S dicluster domain-containing protein [Bacilli bacterium]
MRKLMKLETNIMTIGTPKLKNYLSPDYVYVPLEENFKLNLKENKKVLKGDFITDASVSYVSGSACGIKKCLTVNGIKSCLVIENDFKEQNKKIKKMSNEEMLKYLRTDLSKKLQKKSTNLIFSIIEDEPLVYTYSMLVNNHFQDLLDTIDYLNDLEKFKNIYIVIKDNEKKNIENLISTLGIFPYIKLVTVPNVYPILNTDYLYNILNIKEGIILNPEEVYEINNVLRCKKNVTEKYLSISGTDIKSCVINVKLGTKVSEILRFAKIKNNDCDIFLNGCISGNKVTQLDELIVTKDLRALVFNKKEEEKTAKCISCGLCKAYCPAEINPKYIYENSKIVSKKYLDKCLKCGLCNYVCPSYINLKAAIEVGELNDN